MDIPPLVWGAGSFLAFLGLLFYWPTLGRLLRGGRAGGKVDASVFSGWDIYLAVVLSAWFAWLAAEGFRAGPGEIGPGQLVSGAVLFGFLLVVVFVFLAMRGISPGVAFGFGRLGVWGAILLGVIFLAAGYPALLILNLVTLQFAGGEIQPQEVVSLFAESDSAKVRFGVILMAVVVAPVAEEILFRGYLYGVGKRFLGPLGAAGLSCALFAMIHVHLPSLGVLFFLGLLFVVAYEATGSLFVPMAMHAVFNASQLVLLQVAVQNGGG